MMQYFSDLEIQTSFWKISFFTKNLEKAIIALKKYYLTFLN